jgi:DNA transformation protein
VEDDDLRDLFAAFGPIGIRRMFGGKGLYADGVIFGLVAFGRIWIKADAETQERFREAGSSPFVYEGKARPVTMPYWHLPDEALDDPERIAVWARLGREAAIRAARAKAATKRRRPTS